MIEIILEFSGDIIFVRVEGNSVYFGNTFYGAKLTTIEGLQLNKAGVIKEFPELKDNPNWRLEAIAKFKDKIKNLDGEDKIAHYVIEDLRKFGYTPKYKQKPGFRREVIH